MRDETGKRIIVPDSYEDQALKSGESVKNIQLAVNLGVPVEEYRKIRNEKKRKIRKHQQEKHVLSVIFKRTNSKKSKFVKSSGKKKKDGKEAK